MKLWPGQTKSGLTDGRTHGRINTEGKTFVIDYEGFTFVFFLSKYKQDIYYILCFNFSTVKKYFLIAS